MRVSIHKNQRGLYDGVLTASGHAIFADNCLKWVDAWDILVIEWKRYRGIL